jgi:chemotaxis protein methyltransferase CheR
LTESNKAEVTDDFFEKVAFQKLKTLLKEKAGLNCEGYREEYLRRRFGVRLKATSCPKYGQYLFYVNKNPQEIQCLLNDLTINYTFFFRDSDVFQYLEKTLLPKLFHSNTKVQIWSAGCASGEEPYSLAILAHEILGTPAASRQVSIYASDIDKDALDKAQKGEYLRKQLDGVAESLISKYFTKEGEVYKIKDFVKKSIQFERNDLMKPSLRRYLDLILCRNVMIYFSKEGQQHIHMNFYNALREGGHFITGKAEMLSGEPSQKFKQIELKFRVYQKPKETDFVFQTGLICPAELDGGKPQRA